MLVMKNIGMEVYILCMIIIFYMYVSPSFDCAHQSESTLVCRFEMLQSTTVIHKQPLISPLALHSTPSEEALIMDHLGVFEQNGFHFSVDESQRPGSRLKILTLPFSKSVQFGENDIHELASLIESVGVLCGRTADGSDFTTSQISNLVIKNCDLSSSSSSSLASLRLPKLVSVFASRACRSSIMIGSSLSQQEMRTVVTNLGTIEQPWNCPHGRPTLQYLYDMRESTTDAGKRRNKFLDRPSGL